VREQRLPHLVQVMSVGRRESVWWRAGDGCDRCCHYLLSLSL